MEYLQPVAGRFTYAGLEYARYVFFLSFSFFLFGDVGGVLVRGGDGCA